MIESGPEKVRKAHSVGEIGASSLYRVLEGLGGFGFDESSLGLEGLEYDRP